MKVLIKDQKLVVLWICCGKYTIEEAAQLKHVTEAQIRKWVDKYSKEVLHSMEKEKDTSPLVKSRRIKRQIQIEERNDPPSELFDTTVVYPSDGLPEWFAPLQPIVEDKTFTKMLINLGNRVYYRISIADPEVKANETA